MNEIRFRPIGYVRTKASDDEIRAGARDVISEIEILPEFEEGLEGIDGFSHIMVLFYFHKLRPEQMGVLKVRPKRLLRLGLKPKDLPLLGVFSLDSPSRPNPMGVTIVQLLERKGRLLKVKGLDAFDGTPVLDIKPYTPNRAITDIEVPDWYRRLSKLIGGEEP